VAKKQIGGAIAFVVTIVIGAAMAWAGSQDSVSIGNVPVFALAVGVAFLVQWLVFIPSYLIRTERYFDLTGSITYTIVMTLAVVLSRPVDGRTILLMMLVLLWAARLGSFLYRRVRRTGKDVRFDEIKLSFSRFLVTWTLQGLWVSLTLATALAAVASAHRQPLDALALAGLAVWISGFAIEVVADNQKNRFRADPANAGRFITSGLWARSRHPNYFGEIVLWIGVALIAFPTLSGWQLATLISPAFVFLLLTKVSGVPLLEKKADERWGGQDDYETYKRRTPMLLPLRRARP